MTFGLDLVEVTFFKPELLIIDFLLIAMVITFRAFKFCWLLLG